jgi:flagellar motor switch protein FliM
MAKGTKDDNEKPKKTALSNKEDQVIPQEQDELVGAVKAADLLHTDSDNEGLTGGHSGSGNNLLLQKVNVENQQLPILDVVFDKFIQFFSASAGSFLQSRVEINKLHVTSLEFSNYLAKTPLPALFNIFKIVDWESRGVVMINNNMTYSLINVLLGGKKNGNPAKEKVESRAFSRLETNIVERFVSVALQDLSSAFAFIHPIIFAVERQETIPSLIGGISQSALVSVCSFKLNMGDFEGIMDIIIPHKSLDPIREELVKTHSMEDSLGKVNNWRPLLTEKVLQTHVDVSAILLEDTASLLDVINWKPGTTIPIDVHKFEEVVLRVGNKDLFSGKVGHQNGMISIEVTHVEGAV